MKTIYLASGNAHKLHELQTALDQTGLSFQVLGPDKIGGMPEVEETGTTFEANALLKAHALREMADSDAWFLADDSGIEIDALEAELASTRERAAEATAFAREAARATAATEDLAAARAELETRTAELSRLRGVLKGKLLARVLAEADDTRERVEELDALDANPKDGGDGAW